MVNIKQEDWSKSKNPIYPNIQIITGVHEDIIMIQVQSMVRLYNADGEIYYPLALSSKVETITKLEEFIKAFKESCSKAMKIVDTTAIEDKLIKVEE